MKIAGWDTPFNLFILKALQAAGCTVEFTRSEEARALLVSGLADVALLPTDMALLQPEDFDILPAVASSTWSNPYSSTVLPDGFASQKVTVSGSKESELAQLVASAILKENYRIQVESRPCEGDAHGQEEGMAQLVGAGVSIATVSRDEQVESTPVPLDLGLEWVELTNYPMVWSLFVTRKGEADERLIEALRDMIVTIDEHRPDLLQTIGTELSERNTFEDFCLNELRVRLDDLAVASLTELCDYLYYYGRAESIPAVLLASLSDQEDES